jgi:hypothetical protein
MKGYRNMSDITPARLQELHDTETNLLDKTSTECAALLSRVNETGRQTLTVEEDTRFRRLTNTRQRYVTRIELLEQLMQEAATALPPR